MLSAGALAPYIGFTEAEVKALCKKYNQDFGEVKRWYDGYTVGGFHVYSPNAVVQLMTDGEFQSYWSGTASYEAIVPLINMNYAGLKSAMQYYFKPIRELPTGRGFVDFFYTKTRLYE